jgi:putative acetyltransferase
MQNRSFVIELAQVEDIPAVIQLIGEVYTEYGFIFEPAEELTDLFAFERHYVEPHGAFFVARQNGRIVGSIGVERLATNRAELHRLYLEKNLRGYGFGRALVEAAIAWCREKGITHLMLWSDTRFDRAHALYERMGFQRTGERVLPNDTNQTREYRYERQV